MRIGIIGGGIAGLAAAWLLEQDHEVVLFEKNSFFGGHAQTAYAAGKQGTIPIEIGFEFFNNRMYPHFCRLLSLLSVSVTQYPFTYSFFSTQSSGYVLPPIQGSHIYWHSLTPAKICNLLHLKKAITAGQALIASGQKTISLAEFAQESQLSKRFMHQFFYPLFSAGWGVDHEEFATFSAYNVLSYIVKNKPLGLQPSWWYEINQGMSSYINSLTSALTRTTLYHSTPVERINYHDKKYTIITAQQQHACDHLIIATDAYGAQKLAKTIPLAQRVADALHTISFISATLAIHQDTRFMPPSKKNWSVANVWHNKNYSTLTIYKNRKADQPYFRSWLLPEFPEPTHPLALQQYHHAKPNKNYFMAQEVLAAEQGNNNVWLAGLYTNDIDSHESALNSAITIAQKLCPQSARLNQLLIAA
jgi:predicted NAD/FAD-binding protein